LAQNYQATALVVGLSSAQQKEEQEVEKRNKKRKE